MSIIFFGAESWANIILCCMSAWPQTDERKRWATDCAKIAKANADAFNGRYKESNPAITSQEMLAICARIGNPDLGKALAQASLLRYNCADGAVSIDNDRDAMVSLARVLGQLARKAADALAQPEAASKPAPSPPAKPEAKAPASPRKVDALHAPDPTPPPVNDDEF
jgi:hypothetical protein